MDSTIFFGLEHNSFPDSGNFIYLWKLMGGVSVFKERKKEKSRRPTFSSCVC
jgi:hypothetical protein